MAISLSFYIVCLVMGLALQQYVFMQLVRMNPPLQRIKKVARLSLIFFVLTWVSGLYYYSAFYESFEQINIMRGGHTWVHQYLVEPRGAFLLLLPIFSYFFFGLVHQYEKNRNTKIRTRSLLVALLVLACGAFVLGSELLISWALN